MPFELKYTPISREQIEALGKNKNLAKRFKAVKKALRLLSADPTYPGLNTHKYSSLVGPGGAEVCQAYAENNTPGAYRIFWSYYPPKKKKKDAMATITIIAVTPHP